MRPADTALSHVRLPSSSAAIGHTPKRRGFSLIEAAIVLGVVGVVIGGIWAAASAVSNRFKVATLVQNSLLAFQQAEKLITRQVIEQYPDNTCPDLTRQMISAGAIPHDYVKSASVAKHPWGGQFRVTVCKWGSTERNVGVYLSDPIPASACIETLRTVANNYRSGLAYIAYLDGRPNKHFTAWPIEISELSDAATASSIFYCGFYIPARPN